MAATKTLNARNLETLGAARLAALLIEVSTGNAVAQRRLRLELAGAAGPDEAAQAIAKRLATIARAATHIDWRKVKPLAIELAAHHAAIVEQVAPTDPGAAFRLMWRLLSCADGVYERSSDGSGRLAAVFAAAAAALAPLAKAAKVDPDTLAELVFEAVSDNHYGQWDGLVGTMTPLLGPAGLDRLRDRVVAWRSERPEPDDVGWRRRTATLILQELADARGDVDAYIAQVEPRAQALPAVAAQIVTRLLAAGRTDEAWAALEQANPHGEAQGAAWEQARLATLEALGRTDEAQAFRRARFEATLDAGHLRAHLRRLPDFEDIEAERHAIDHALHHPDAHRALAFLIEWPALDQAARLVTTRAGELDGDRYELFGPAAEILGDRHPLAALLLRRAMIDVALGRGRSARYGHAARHLHECAALATRIDAFGDVPTHDAYLRRLRTDHGRKYGFWQAVADLGPL